MRQPEGMSKAHYQFSPDNLNLKTATGIREPNVIRIPKVIGMALYGPYVDLPAGRYEAVIRFDPDTPCHGEALMDVCAAVGTRDLPVNRLVPTRSAFPA